MVEARFERGGCLIALGGGVVGDVAGFAAATYHRGIDWIQVPTTLLAMADSSVGGKTAIDHPHGKNLIGAFHQPRAVVADLDLLATLPEREIRSGFAEVIKAGLIADPELFRMIEGSDSPLWRDRDALAEGLRRAVAVKARIVEQDEREGGRRAILNFGHTFGHALEAAAGFGTWTHGEAVAVGMAFAVLLSAEMGFISSEDAGRVSAVLERWGYRIKAAGMPAEKILAALRLDKKAAGGQPLWVLLRGLGKAEWGVAAPPEMIRRLVETFAEERVRS